MAGCDLEASAVRNNRATSIAHKEQLIPQLVVVTFSEVEK